MTNRLVTFLLYDFLNTLQSLRLETIIHAEQARGRIIVLKTIEESIIQTDSPLSA